MRRCNTLVMVHVGDGTINPIDPTIPSMVLNPQQGPRCAGAGATFPPQGAAPISTSSGSRGGCCGGCLWHGGADVPPQQERDTNGFSFSSRDTSDLVAGGDTEWLWTGGTE